MDNQQDAELSPADTRPSFARRHKVALTVLAVLVVLAGVGAIALSVAVHERQEQERLGLGAVAEPGMPKELAASGGKAGAFTTEIEFTTMADNSGHRVATEVTWDDDWFFQHSTVYNHELATTCSVLSAAANSESAYFQAGTAAPA